MGRAIGGDWAGTFTEIRSHITVKFDPQCFHSTSKVLTLGRPYCSFKQTCKVSDADGVARQIPHPISKMLNSYQIADELKQRDFHPISLPERTKAHGYRHAALTFPVYVKIRGAKGALEPTAKSPLVIDIDEAEKIVSAGGWPEGVEPEAAPYHSAGLLAFPKESGKTPSGRALSIRDLTALTKLLDKMLGTRHIEAGR